ncbi:SURF1 family protein [Aminobacter sp. NyZ550]|uniref:SURF1 family protein n=1 Tax=Aminobacter sp. NyZ550 TaxID=2979870 RepID=UPI0021D5DE8A|nr:SURF1 family protein [Aminobacter sp. NyZ550]WAX94685.1 SURF1 family protein [Aminobacter sp. NyZ550]
MIEQNTLPAPARRSGRVLMLVLGTIAFALLIGLGSWQVERLNWKEGLIAQINERTQMQPLRLAEMEVKYRATGDVDYWPVTLSGTFEHAGERHFLATWEGQSGFYVYTPLKLDDGRFVMVNRGFVPYDFKDAAKRPVGQVTGPVSITGLARNPLAGKPGSLVPDNDPAKNVFYWKDLGVMAATAGLPADAAVVPFFVDADKTPNPGGLPVGGVTMVDMPNNHLQYAVTWYGLAAALLGVMGFWLLRRPESK